MHPDKAMNLQFLQTAFAKIPKETIETAVSNINAYRNFIGNGVAVGKLAEVIIARMFTSEGIHGFSFAFTGKNPPFDIMIYARKEPLARDAFTSLRKLYQINFDTFCKGISKAVGSDQWCGVSLKNYLNHESQVTTNYQIRTICEEMLGEEVRVYKDAATVKGVVDRSKVELSHETILLLNSFPHNKAYQFRLFNLDSLKIATIEFSKKAKHTRYVFGDGSGDIFHIKYGKNQANPFQRGIWIDDLEKLPLLASGSYHQSAFGKYLLDGALRYHKPTDDEDEGLAMGERAVAEDRGDYLPLT